MMYYNLAGENRAEVTRKFQILRIKFECVPRAVAVVKREGGGEMGGVLRLPRAVESKGRQNAQVNERSK
jgi:hypothetical protein